MKKYIAYQIDNNGDIDMLYECETIEDLKINAIKIYSERINFYTEEEIEERIQQKRSFVFSFKVWETED